MNQRKVILFIACSLDGYIAAEDGSISFLAEVRVPNEDYGYHAFVETVDTVIMGRKTYEQVLGFGDGMFPHTERRCIVLSKTNRNSGNGIEFFKGSITQLIKDLKNENGKNIFLDGGSEAVCAFMQEDLVDRFVISIIPYFLGKGIPLFKSGRKEQRLRLVSEKKFESGLVQLTYDVIRSA